MKPNIDGSVKCAMFTLVEGLVLIALSIAVNHSFLTDVEHDNPYPLGKTSFDILKIKNVFNSVSVAFFGFLVVASVLPPTAVRKNVPFFYGIYILVVMMIAVFMIAGIAVYTALLLNIQNFTTHTLNNHGKQVYENRHSGTLAMLIIYSVFFFFHCVCAAYSIYHYFTWRANLQRLTSDLEPSAMHYHDGMVNASYMHDRPPMDPRYFWPTSPTSGADPPGSAPPGAFGPPPEYSSPIVPPTRDEKPGDLSDLGNENSEAGTNTDPPSAAAEACSSLPPDSGGNTSTETQTEQSDN